MQLKRLPQIWLIPSYLVMSNIWNYPHFASLFVWRRFALDLELSAMDTHFTEMSWYCWLFGNSCPSLDDRGFSANWLVLTLTDLWVSITSRSMYLSLSPYLKRRYLESYVAEPFPVVYTFRLGADGYLPPRNWIWFFLLRMEERVCVSLVSVRFYSRPMPLNHSEIISLGRLGCLMENHEVIGAANSSDTELCSVSWVGIFRLPF